ncbi:MAG: recombination mediator RecR [Phycisphaeraceae bacterium JB051]
MAKSPKPSTQSPALNRLIDQLSTLPGVGRRSAERIAFHLLKSPSDQTVQLADAIRDFAINLKICSACGNATDTDPCPICVNDQRDHQTILVVEKPSDIVQLETTGQYNGVYHVLMGRLSPLDDIGPGELNFDALLDRVKKQDVREVILGMHPTAEGDGTALYLADQLNKLGVTLTRLARGLPVGASLDTVSKAVLGDALHGRRHVDS